jgi:GNAT superfamily N-acetyltransferase
MTIEIRRVRRGDPAAHEQFHAFVPLTFRGVDFRRWDERGGWNDDYEAWLLEHDGEVVASTGLMRMRLLVAGEERRGYQLGAVSTHPARRGHGYSRMLLEAVLAQIDDEQAPALLFANERVLAFYPRFGFRIVAQRRFVADAAIDPTAVSAPRCDMGDATHRARLDELCRDAPANDPRFGARDYFTVLLWHLTYRPIQAFRLDHDQAIAVVERRGDTLVLHDLVARRPFDLAAALPSLIDAPIARIEFGFSPRRWWPQANSVGAYAGSPLFVRGIEDLAEPLRFPDLAQT